MSAKIINIVNIGLALTIPSMPAVSQLGSENSVTISQRMGFCEVGSVYQSKDFSNIPNKFYTNIDKLQKLKGLKAGWDGEDATPFCKDTVNTVEHFLSSILEYQPKVFPTPSSEIQLEFYNALGNYLQIVFVDSNTVEIFYVDEKNNDNNYYTDNYTYTEKGLSNTVRGFMNGKPVRG